MRLGIASWSFILITLIILVVKDGSARKIALKTETDNQLMKPLHYDLKHSPTEDLVINNIMQVNKNSDEKESGEEEDNDDNHHKHQEKVDSDSDDDEEEEEDDDEEDDHDDDHKKKGKQESKKEHKDEHKKLIKDPEQNLFFTPKDLYVGKTMRAYFAKKNYSSSPKFLPREEAEQIPFTKKNFPSILKLFSIPKHSPQAKAMKHTLKNCEFEAMEGETNTNTKFCATSLESLLDSARQVFGSDPQLKVLTTTHIITNSTTVLQNYTVTEVKEIISVPNVLGCHPMPYPYAVFFCQTQKNDTKLYEVLVEGENGAKVQAAAVCHVDTSKWDSAPGKSPVCHFFHSDNLVLVLSPAATPSP